MPSRVSLVVGRFAPFVLAGIVAFTVPGGGGHPSYGGHSSNGRRPVSRLPVIGGRSAFGGWPLTHREIRPFMFFGVVSLGSGALRSTTRGDLRFVVARMLFHGCSGASADLTLFGRFSA